MLRQIEARSKELVLFIFTAVILSFALNIIASYIFSERKSIWILIVALVFVVASITWVLIFLLVTSENTERFNITAAIFYDPNTEEMVWPYTPNDLFGHTLWFGHMARAWEHCKEIDELPFAIFDDHYEPSRLPSFEIMDCLVEYGILSTLSQIYSVGWQREDVRKLPGGGSATLIASKKQKLILAKDIPAQIVENNPLFTIDSLSDDIHLCLPPKGAIIPLVISGTSTPFPHGIKIETNYIDFEMYSLSSSGGPQSRKDNLIERYIAITGVCKIKRKLIWAGLLSRNKKRHVSWAEDVIDVLKENIDYKYDSLSARI